jgi:glycerol-3-phosphate dehydrogenase (NAD(P)+)
MKIAVIGCGAWATALCNVFSNNHHTCVMYGSHEDTFDNERHINKRYFPEVVLSPLITYTTSLQECVFNADMILFCIPSIAIRDMARKIGTFLDHEITVLSAAKGFDPTTFEPLSNVLKEELPSKYVRGVVSLIGPSFASEVIQNKVTTICAVSEDLIVAAQVQSCFSNETFRIYTNDDEIGCQCGAALKNVIAIAGGAIYGLGEGENAKAGLVTRGVREMVRFGTAIGGRPETFFGLTGVGDLLLTCSSMQSRNYSLGYLIGKNDDAGKVLQENQKTCEGVHTCLYAYELAKQKNLDMPILESVYRVLYSNEKPSKCLKETMLRQLKSEL